jgi:SAM-dependent methyltransferase
MDANREVWDRLVPVHTESKFYDVEGFRAGRCTLDDLDLEEVGDVLGRHLLHLLCHFGMDTLSWARLGARVTGVDFSEEAIAFARRLGEELGLSAEFVCCNVYSLREYLDGQFDVVLATEGVLSWLPDLDAFASTAAFFLEPGGTFYLRDFHPMAGALDDGGPEPCVRYPYFRTEAPLEFEDAGTYADPQARVGGSHFEWAHSLSELFTALRRAGLRLTAFREFPYTTYPSHPFLRMNPEGAWHCPSVPGGLPLMFLVKAVKT